jgi:hypothetical protein
MSAVPAMKDWHSHWSRAAPVSVPVQKELAGEVVSQLEMHGGVFWACASNGVVRRRALRALVGFMVVWELCLGTLLRR